MGVYLTKSAVLKRGWVCVAYADNLMAVLAEETEKKYSTGAESHLKVVCCHPLIFHKQSTSCDLVPWNHSGLMVTIFPILLLFWIILETLYRHSIWAKNWLLISGQKYVKRVLYYSRLPCAQNNNNKNNSGVCGCGDVCCPVLCTLCQTLSMNALTRFWLVHSMYSFHFK